jgi:hypothetical protein
MQARLMGRVYVKHQNQTRPHKPALAQEPDFVFSYQSKKRLCIIFFALSAPLSRDRSSIIDLPGLSASNYQEVNPPKQSPSSRNIDKSKALESRQENEVWAARRFRVEEIGRLKVRQRRKAEDSILAEERS